MNHADQFENSDPCICLDVRDSDITHAHFQSTRPRAMSIERKRYFSIAEKIEETPTSLMQNTMQNL